MKISARAGKRLILVIGKWAILVFLAPPLHADFDSAANAYRAKDYLIALEEFEPLAEQGDPRAQTVLALMYKYGEGTQQDLDSSFAWYRKAAELGYAPAQYHTGVMLADGVGVDMDIDEAIEWLTRSAESGFSRANDKLEELHASRVIASTTVDEFVPWSQSWDFNLPNELRFRLDDDSTFSPVASIPNYRVQLGAMSSKLSAEQLWIRLMNDNPSLFEGLSLLVKESIRPNRTLYRVQTGPFDTLGQARSFCANLTNSRGNAIGCLALQPTP
ncbi:MAG: SPOR domain-containing protein [Gammaproteobacteria bacterium]|nr:SPOR domain-containing protein [Gammaproteobacteria bacterium]